MRPFPLFLSFNTFTSLLNHDFLLVLNPFVCVEPSFSDFLCSSSYPPFAMPCFPPPRARFLEPLEEFPLVVPFPEAHLLSRYLPCPRTPLRGRSLTLTQAGLVLWASSTKHPALSIYLFRPQVSRCLPCSLSESYLSSVPGALK